MIFDPVAFGRAVRCHREALGWSMRDMARIGIDNSTVCRIESGKAMNVETYLKLLVWLGESLPALPKVCQACKGRGYFL